MKKSELHFFYDPESVLPLISKSRLNANMLKHDQRLKEQNIDQNKLKKLQSYEAATIVADDHKN